MRCEKWLWFVFWKGEIYTRQEIKRKWFLWRVLKNKVVGVGCSGEQREGVDLTNYILPLTGSIYSSYVWRMTRLTSQELVNTSMTTVFEKLRSPVT